MRRYAAAVAVAVAVGLTWAAGAGRGPAVGAAEASAVFGGQSLPPCPNSDKYAPDPTKLACNSRQADTCSGQVGNVCNNVGVECAYACLIVRESKKDPTGGVGKPVAGITCAALGVSTVSPVCQYDAATNKCVCSQNRLNTIICTPNPTLVAQACKPPMSGPITAVE